MRWFYLIGKVFSKKKRNITVDESFDTIWENRKNIGQNLMNIFGIILTYSIRLSSIQRTAITTIPDEQWKLYPHPETKSQPAACLVSDSNTELTVPLLYSKRQATFRQPLRVKFQLLMEHRLLPESELDCNCLQLLNNTITVVPNLLFENAEISTQDH